MSENFWKMRPGQAEAGLYRLMSQSLPRECQHWDRDVFIDQPPGESAGGLAGVRFSIDPGRQADRVLIENLNIYGLGTFSRAK
jgi:hypothetical protein